MFLFVVFIYLRISFVGKDQNCQSILHQLTTCPYTDILSVFPHQQNSLVNSQWLTNFLSLLQKVPVKVIHLQSRLTVAREFKLS